MKNISTDIVFIGGGPATLAILCGAMKQGKYEVY